MMLKMFTASSHDRFTATTTITEIRQKAEMSSPSRLSILHVGES